MHKQNSDSVLGNVGGAQVQAMVDAGYLDILVDFADHRSYWENMMKEYPDHPLKNDAARQSNSFGATLYGNLDP